MLQLKGLKNLILELIYFGSALRLYPLQVYTGIYPRLHVVFLRRLKREKAQAANSNCEVRNPCLALGTTKY